jgi:hypothetical protein
MNGFENHDLVGVLQRGNFEGQNFLSFYGLSWGCRELPHVGQSAQRRMEIFYLTAR